MKYEIKEILLWVNGQENGQVDSEKKCKCECGKENGAERVEQCFDAEHIDAMIHDGETRVVIFYSCEECKNKYGSSREIYK